MAWKRYEAHFIDAYCIQPPSVLYENLRRRKESEADVAIISTVAHDLSRGCSAQKVRIVNALRVKLSSRTRYCARTVARLSVLHPDILIS